MKTLVEALKRKTLMSNGTMHKKQDDRYNSIVLSIATSAIIGCFIFLWNVNSDIAKIEQQNIETGKTIDEIMIRNNNMQLDIRDIRERIIRLEAFPPKK